MISGELYVIFLGPAGGSCTLTGAEQLHMTRRAFPSSRSNTGAGEIEIKQACQKSWQLGHKSEDFSKSVSSFDTGASFLSVSGHDLSRNAGGVSVYAF